MRGIDKFRIENQVAHEPDFGSRANRFHLDQFNHRNNRFIMYKNYNDRGQIVHSLIFLLQPISGGSTSV